MWIAFGVAVAATLLSFGAFLVALLRENHTFSGLSALGVLVAGWTVIDTLVFNKPAALWVAFAGGLILPLLTLRSLGRHETTIERVVHALEREPSAALEPEQSAIVPPTAGRSSDGGTVGPPSIGLAKRSWAYWLAHTRPGAGGCAGRADELRAHCLRPPPRRGTVGRVRARDPRHRHRAHGARRARASRGNAGPEHRDHAGRLARALLSTSSVAIAIALIVTMALLTGGTARWVAFALGCGIIGASLLAHIAHELTSERVRH